MCISSFAQPITVGLITLESNSSYTTQLWLGANDSAAQLGVNLITFGIGEEATKLASDAEQFYDYLDHLVDCNHLDGLLIWTAGLLKDHAYASSFLAHYARIPLVSLGIDTDGVHRILTDGYNGMFQLVSHLIVSGKRCKLAFITGQASNYDAQLRLNAYRDAVKLYGLPIGEEYVVSGAFSWDSQIIGRRAVAELLDNRKLGLDAIIASSDDLAIGVLQGLHERGISVPSQIAVTGFDNIPDCSAVFPPLTTVAQPAYTMAWQGLEMLVDLTQGKSTAEKITIPAELVLRQSCGTQHFTPLAISRQSRQSTRNRPFSMSRHFQEGRAAYHALLAASFTRDNRNHAHNLLDDQIATVLDSFEQTLANEAPDAFLQNMQQILYATRTQVEVAGWRHGLDALLEQFQEALHETAHEQVDCDKQVQTRCMLLEKDLQLLFEQVEHHFTQYHAIEEKRLANQLHMVSRSLLIPYHPEQLVEIFAQQLPGIGIELAYIAGHASVYSSPDDVELIVAYDPHAKGENLVPGHKYRAADIASGRLILQGRTLRLLVIPLYSNRVYAGFVVFGFGPRSYQHYTQLASALGYSLANNLLLQQIHTYADQLEAHVADRTAALNATNVRLQAEIEERKRIEESLAQAHANAVKASQMKSDFLATMSHEIRTPMNGIAGMTELLLDSGLNEEQRSYAKIAYEESYKLLDIINSILDFSKIEAGKVVLEEIEFAPAAELESVVRLLAPKAQEKDISLLSAIAPQVPAQIIGDPVRLRQILTNLAGNAVKFTNKGEVVVVIACQFDPSMVSAADGAVLPLRLQITIRDTGIGMSPETLDNLFTVFTQADSSTTRRYGGTGLGLAITHRLVGLMGGTIAVESEVGVGSKFVVTIPVGCRTKVYQAAIEHHDSSAPGHCLVVSNNSTLYRQLANYFATWSIRTVSYAELKVTNIKLLQHLYQSFVQGPAYSCLIIDELDGGIESISFARSLRADPLLNKVYLLLIAARSTPVLRTQYMAAGFDAILSYPITQSGLYEVISPKFLSNSSEPDRINIEQNETVTAGAPSEKLVLVVEDYPNNQLLILAYLKKLGYAAHVVENGQAAVDAIATSRDRYQMILMDWQMPIMDGIEATRRIRKIEAQSTDHIPIIGMTANALKGAREECLEAGMDDYISKPIRGQELKQIIDLWNTKANPIWEI